MYRRILTVIAVMAVIGAFGTGGLARSHVGQSHGQVLAYSASDKSVTFATDPSMYGGGDQRMDNLYTLDNNICTDGIAITVAHQTLGDLSNTAAHQGHSLELSSIQDYGTTAPTLPLGFDSAGSPTAGTNVPIREGTSPDGGFTFASAADNTPGANGTIGGTVGTDPLAGTWQGSVYKAHYGTVGSPISEPVGEQIVGSFVRADHGFVINEDDSEMATNPNSNGDDGRFNAYQGWGGTDDGGNGVDNTPPTQPNLDGDWYTSPADNVAPTDGSSFDDIIRTDQSPGSSFDPNNPNSAPSFMIAPNPATSTVSDCVIDQAPPQTTATYPSANSNGWYTTSPVSVSLAVHKVYYLGGPTTTYYNLDGTGWQSGTSLSITTDGKHTLQYYSADSAKPTPDTETTHTATFNVDATPPSVHFTNCPASPLALGSTASASWSASDPTPGSGLSTAGSGTSSLDTSTPGQHSVSTAVPQDFAGNTGTADTCTYTVQYAVKLLYKPPMSAKSGSSVPIKLELTNSSGTNLSSAGLSVQALCVVPVGSTSCASAPAGFNYSNQFFTYLTTLAPGGGYQYNAKSTGLAIIKTYQVLFRVAGESSSTYHADALATFKLTK